MFEDLLQNILIIIALSYIMKVYAASMNAAISWKQFWQSRIARFLCLYKGAGKHKISHASINLRRNEEWVTQMHSLYFSRRMTQI